MEPPEIPCRHHRLSRSVLPEVAPPVPHRQHHLPLRDSVVAVRLGQARHQVDSLAQAVLVRQTQVVPPVLVLV
jgi:hypothetical protein